ncbi:Wzz/FepE/Etk N-terminal domain-containing protein [Thiohalomonas denitrificans]|uniref:Wzz/FepE/Etk N-terminal domain-containing protein n=1 Tax=Thiohalomonas denitrificans TaxID=415747 RepID=UPI0026EF80BE|nr:Wzz/FepE/Etk N-terminal domain-containing protein [Thiohalomonas denitrificans]
MHPEQCTALNPYARLPPDDEISLIDIGLVLLRRRWMVIGLTLLGLIAGTLMATLREPVYTYETTTEIGGWWQGSGSKRNYLPISSAVLIEDAAKEAIAAVAEGLHARAAVSKDGRRMTITSEGTAARAERIAAVHQAAIVRLADAHDDLLDAAKGEIEARLARTKMRHAQLDGEIRSRARLATVFEETSLRLAAVDGANRVGAPLLDVSERLFEAQEGLKRSQEQREQLIAEAKALGLALDSIRPTDPTDPAGETVRSGPGGAGIGVIVALAAILGLFAGFFGAFFAEFLTKVRQAQTVN